MRVGDCSFEDDVVSVGDVGYSIGKDFCDINPKLRILFTPSTVAEPNVAKTFSSKSLIDLKFGTPTVSLWIILKILARVRNILFHKPNVYV